MNSSVIVKPFIQEKLKNYYILEFYNIEQLNPHTCTLTLIPVQNIKKTFEKKGIKISQQRIKYFKTNELEINSETNTSDYRQLLISEIEEDGVFYCIYDYITMGRMGQKTRYKFQIKDFQQSMNLSDYNIELLDKTMIMIR